MLSNLNVVLDVCNGFIGHRVTCYTSPCTYVGRCARNVSLVCVPNTCGMCRAHYFERRAPHREVTAECRTSYAIGVCLFVPCPFSIRSSSTLYFTSRHDREAGHLPGHVALCGPVSEGVHHRRRLPGRSQMLRRCEGQLWQAVRQTADGHDR